MSDIHFLGYKLYPKQCLTRWYGDGGDDDDGGGDGGDDDDFEIAYLE